MSCFSVPFAGGASMTLMASDEHLSECSFIWFKWLPVNVLLSNFSEVSLLYWYLSAHAPVHLSSDKLCPHWIRQVIQLLFGYMHGLQCSAKHTFANAVYATANLSIRLSFRHTPILSKRGNAEGCSLHHRIAQCLFLIPRKVAGGQPCLGKISAQRGRPLWKQPSSTEHISPRNSGTIIDSTKGPINLTIGFPTSHQPRSCVTPNFPKMGFQYPSLLFSQKFRPATIKSLLQSFVV